MRPGPCAPAGTNTHVQCGCVSVCSHTWDLSCQAGAVWGVAAMQRLLVAAAALQQQALHADRTHDVTLATWQQRRAGTARPGTWLHAVLLLTTGLTSRALCSSTGSVEPSSVSSITTATRTSLLLSHSSSVVRASTTSSLSCTHDMSACGMMGVQWCLGYAGEGCGPGTMHSNVQRCCTVCADCKAGFCCTVTITQGARCCCTAGVCQCKTILVRRGSLPPGASTGGKVP